MNDQYHASHGSLAGYTLGFGLSIILTLLAYVAVDQQLLSGQALILSIVGLAVAQLFVQLLFFLHLGSESKPRWNLTVFLFMALVVLIVVVGSLWIMNNLDYHSTSPVERDEYMLRQGQKGF